MSVSFNPDAIFAAISPKIEKAINETIEAATDDARSRAPSRKVFRGNVGRTRQQTHEEVAAEAAVRSRLGLAPGPVQTQRTPAASVHQFGFRRLLTSPKLPAFDISAARFRAPSGRFISKSDFRGAQPLKGTLRFMTTLSSRGRYELKTGRANITMGGKSYVGGRLRSQIKAQLSDGGPQFTGAILSPTPYARFVEFGTRRSRAQPYIRPAVAAQREQLRQRLTRAVLG